LPAAFLAYTITYCNEQHFNRARSAARSTRFSGWKRA
jgi:hypothetical protein